MVLALGCTVGLCIARSLVYYWKCKNILSSQICTKYYSNKSNSGVGFDRVISILLNRLCRQGLASNQGVEKDLRMPCKVELLLSYPTSILSSYQYQIWPPPQPPEPLSHWGGILICVLSGCSKASQCHRLYTCSWATPSRCYTSWRHLLRYFVSW